MQSASADEAVDTVFAVNVYDDASMWVRDPSHEIEIPDKALSIIQRKLGRMGKNVHLKHIKNEI